MVGPVHAPAVADHSDRGVLAASAALTDCWHVVASSADVSGAVPTAVTLLGRELVLWRSPNGTVVAAPDRCPHRQAPLSAGHVDHGCLVCPYHGWTFADRGRAVQIPSAGTGVPVPPRAHLQTVAVEEHYGLVWVCLGTPRQRVPRVSYDDDPAFRRINTPVEIWRTSTLRIVDNFLDVGHFPYVHTGTFGGAQDPVVPTIELGELHDGFHGYRYEILAANTAEGGSLASGRTEPVIERAMSTGFALPFIVRSTIRYAGGLEHVILMASTPIDDVTSYFTFVIWRNDDFSVPAEDVIRFDLAIGAEDKRMLELIPGMLPLDRTGVVSVQADRCSVEWRRCLVALMGSDEAGSDEAGSDEPGSDDPGGGPDAEPVPVLTAGTDAGTVVHVH